MKSVYIVDRMVLANSRFAKVRQFREYLRMHAGISYLIIDEISYESRGADDYSAIDEETVKKITPDHIHKLKKIVPELISQGILSMDQGNGDVMLATECMLEDEPMLFGSSSKILVTDDKKLAGYCRTKSISVISSSNFFQLADGAINTTAT